MGRYSPFGWYDWAAFEKRPEFIVWATPPSRRGRYAVVNDRGFIRWALVWPDGDHETRSGGAFYDEYHPEGAVAGAIAAARKHARKRRTYLR